MKKTPEQINNFENLRTRFLEPLQGKRRFMLGDVACAYGALFAGCNFFGAYPITPASEIGETLAKELPKTGGFFVQFEDEIASLCAVIGSVWAGATAMTATSGPGFSLMQEGVGYAIMTETPCVIVNVQRSGPSTGQATKGAQSDIMQARWGTHGDHEIIALSPSSAQECFDFTIDCFNLAEQYRTPVILLTDGEIGHIRESVIFPYLSDVKLIKRRKSSKIMSASDELIPPMQEFGEGTFVHVTGSTHKPNGMREVESQSVHDNLVRRLYAKIDANREIISRVEKESVEAAEILILSYGASARASRGAFMQAKSEGIPVGFMRLITIWPFPKHEIREISKRVKKIIVPEMNMGQLSREVERFADCEVITVSKIGGISHTIEEIYKVVRKIL
ncbi:MAG: 2-oxoacid:acceptor oxidoreductase subunit alpha [Planctomycetota bacterium]